MSQVCVYVILSDGRGSKGTRLRFLSLSSCQPWRQALDLVLLLRGGFISRPRSTTSFSVLYLNKLWIAPLILLTLLTNLASH